MKHLIKQVVSYSRLTGLSASFQELDIAAENNTQFVITERDEFRFIQKPSAFGGGQKLNEVSADYYQWSEVNESVFVTRYKLDDDEHDFDFYEIASHEFANFELTKDLWVNRNGEIEPRRSEVA